MELNPANAKIKKVLKAINEISEKYPCASKADKSAYEAMIKDGMDSIAKHRKDSMANGKIPDPSISKPQSFEEYMFELKKKECLWPNTGSMGSFSTFCMGLIILFLIWVFIMG